MIPEPTIKAETAVGRLYVVRWVEIKAGGSCHCEVVGLRRGSPGGMEARCSMKNDWGLQASCEKTVAIKSIFRTRST